MRRRAVALGLLISACLGAQGSAAAADQAEEPGLERVVLITRHGIRSPTKSPEALKALTGHDWPQWPVAPGMLTPHGRDALAAMAAAVGQRYRQRGLFGSAGCPAAERVFIWGDSADARTRESAAIYGASLLPSCAYPAHSLAAGQHDPVFNALKTANWQLDRSAVTAALREALARDAAHRPASVRRALEAEQHLIAPEGCEQAAGICLTGPVNIGWRDGQPRLLGGPSLGASIAENTLLAYVQGMPPQVVSGEEKNAAAFVGRVMSAHTYISQLIRRSPPIAGPRAAVLTHLLGAIMRGDAVTMADGTVVPAEARMIVLAGHDTTLDMMAAILGLSWAFDDQPDPTAPDTALALERWRLSDGLRVVRVLVLHQSLEELRYAWRPSRTSPAFLPVAACHGITACSVGDFIHIMMLP